ncbi:hypothetical protein KP509_14G074300 [Ceratopteris richardii]|uniref:Uncharacterized protein n=1 Tax=Ceratopteris richardii TaxID=49495 RepID=A0A8T2TD85_CERRI|nr:hypothetical protein KP509_14G074300 [Ceratopteris richardii]
MSGELHRFSQHLTSHVLFSLVVIQGAARWKPSTSLVDTPMNFCEIPVGMRCTPVACTRLDSGVPRFHFIVQHYSCHPLVTIMWFVRHHNTVKHPVRVVISSVGYMSRMHECMVGTQLHLLGGTLAIAWHYVALLSRSTSPFSQAPHGLSVIVRLLFGMITTFSLIS